MGKGRAGPRLLLQLRLLLNAPAAHPPALAPAARLRSGLARLCARLRCARLGLAASLVHASTSPLASCRGGEGGGTGVRWNSRGGVVCSWQSRTVLAAAALLLLGRGRLSCGSGDSWGHGGGGWHHGRRGGGGGRGWRLGRVGIVFATSLVLALATTLSSAPRARLRGVVVGLHRAARGCVHHACTMPRLVRVPSAC